MTVTDRRLPWLPSMAGSVVIHGAFAALVLSVLPQLPPAPEETQISIAPLDASTVNPLQPGVTLGATPADRSRAAGLPVSVGVAPPLTSAQSAPASGQQTSVNAIETGMAEPFAVPRFASSPAPSDSAAPLETSAIAGLVPSLPADAPREDAALPLDIAQLPARASEARAALALAEQQSARPLSPAAAETVPIGGNASGPLDGAISAGPAAHPQSIAPLDAPAAAEPPDEAEIAAPVAPEQVATLPAPVHSEPPLTMQTAEPSPTSQTAGPMTAARVAGSPPPTTAADPATAATTAPSATTTALADGVATDLAAPLAAARADTVARSGVAEALDATRRTASDLPAAVADSSVPSASVATSNEASLAAAPPGTPPAAEQVAAERMAAGAGAASRVSPTPTAAIAPAPAANQTADPVRTVTVQFVQAGDRAADAAVLPMAQTAVAPKVGGNAFDRDGDGSGSAGSAAAPISREVFAAPGPVPGAIAADPVTPPTLAEVADMIRDYPAECLAAVVGTGSDGLVQVTAYGQPTTIAAFARDLRAQMGEMVPLSTTAVSGAQCTVLEAMQNWTGYPATGPALELSSRQIAGGGTVVASVPGAPADWIYLLLVDQDGTAIKLAEYVAEAEGTTRSPPPVEISRSADTPQLIVSIVSPTALASMAEDAAQPAGQIFQALESELERRQIRATLSVTAFTIQ
ncbi:MAG TPA: hypothetical protein VGN80_06255 [Devosiaceae bacterium]|jgi:hypothetical protein|nr:hypothetical protein [Devosiaceae bacterium]